MHVPQVIIDGVVYLPSQVHTYHWTACRDEDGNAGFLPSDARQCLVFLFGDREIVDARSGDAGWGLRFGFFDHDIGMWRVGGRPEKYVTHWMECPAGPNLIKSKD